jgi:hypothetical protein
MNIQPSITRVPFFYFKDVEVGEDAQLSLELGYSVPKLVTFIYVTPHGNRDPMEFAATEWLERKEKEARQGLYDYSWVKAFKEGLALHKNGKEIPRTGTPILTWERTTKARREQLANLYPTVEDLAAVPDSALSQIGMDGRVIRDLARGDIQAKKDLSPVVRELANANETIRRQEEQLASLALRLEALESNSKSKKAN